jgi:hypothetical protein
MTSAGATMLLFNERYFAKLNRKLDASGGHGFFKTITNGVQLHDLSGKLRAFIVANDRQGHFVVTASTDGTGRAFYMHSTCSTEEKWLGIECMGLSQLEQTIKGMRYCDGLKEISSAAPVLTMV